MPRLRLALVALAASIAALVASTSLPHVSAVSADGSYDAARTRLIEDVPLTIASAPINYDGDVAGKETHLVLMLPDAGDPRASGLSVDRGGTITIVLPPDFTRSAAQPIDVALPRWPQANICCYSSAAEGNVITLTFKTPVRVDGPFAPGLRVLGHIRGAFTNPAAGDYVIRAGLRQSPDAPLLIASGAVHILETAPHARLAPTNWLLPKGGNANFQTVLVGQEVPALLSLLLWRDGKPLDGVGLMPPDPDLYPLSSIHRRSPGA